MHDTSALLTTVVVKSGRPNKNCSEMYQVSKSSNYPVQATLTECRSTFRKSLNSRDKSLAVLDEFSKHVALLVTLRVVSKSIIVTKSVCCRSLRPFAPWMQRRSTICHQSVSTGIHPT